MKAVEDEKLLDYLVEHQIGIESCITSNLQTSTVADISQHPLKTFLEHGILATINSDDPAVEGIDIQHEYLQAAPQAGLSKVQIRQAQQNGLSIAFYPLRKNSSFNRKYRSVILFQESINHLLYRLLFHKEKYSLGLTSIWKKIEIEIYLAYE